MEAANRQLAFELKTLASKLEIRPENKNSAKPKMDLGAISASALVFHSEDAFGRGCEGNEKEKERSDLLPGNSENISFIHEKEPLFQIQVCQ